MFVVAEERAATGPGFYLSSRPRGVVVHMTASACHLQFVRELTEKALCDAGIDDETTANVQLVLSELIGNSIRACGEFVPLVIVIDAGLRSVTVIVHDPEGDRLPLRPETALDDPDAESGRGLALIDLLAPGWQVRRTPFGKQVVCNLPCVGGA